MKKEFIENVVKEWETNTQFPYYLNVLQCLKEHLSDYLKCEDTRDINIIIDEVENSLMMSELQSSMNCYFIHKSLDRMIGK